jgi:GDPmannose 4,6-dehydratase
MEKNIFITGITGMVGSHLLDFLIKNTNHKIYGLARWNDSLENIEHLSEEINSKNRIELIYGDLNDLVSLINAIKISKPDYVFHLAAQSYPHTSFESPIETLQTNILGTTNLLEAIRKSEYEDAIIHVCSSSEIFGRVTKDKLPIDEECTIHPASPYAISKSGTDLIGRYYAEAYKMNIVTTRMFTHTGPRRGDVFSESTFAKQIAMIEAKYIKPIIKVGNLNSLRTYGDVRDAVRAYYMSLTTKPKRGEYYNIGGNHTCTVGDMLKELLSISNLKNYKIEIDKERLRPIDADLQVPNISKFQKHTKWKPEITFQKTMADLLNYWRNKIKQKNFLGLR